MTNRLTDDDFQKLKRIAACLPDELAAVVDRFAREVQLLRTSLPHAPTSGAGVGLTEEEREDLATLRGEIDANMDHAEEMLREEERVTEIERWESRLKTRRRVRNTIDRLLQAEAAVPQASAPATLAVDEEADRAAAAALNARVKRAQPKSGEPRPLTVAGLRGFPDRTDEWINWWANEICEAMEVDRHEGEHDPAAELVAASSSEAWRIFGEHVRDTGAGEDMLDDQVVMSELDVEAAAVTRGSFEAPRACASDFTSSHRPTRGTP